MKLYLHEQDVPTLLAWLNSENVAYIMPDGEDRWKAVRTVEDLPDEHYLIWYLPAGPLSISQGESVRIIDDPWGGWEAVGPNVYRGVVRHLPYHHNGLFAFMLFRGRDGEVIPPSYIGDSRPGQTRLLSTDEFDGVPKGYPRKQTKRWWKRLRVWAARTGTRVRIKEPLEGPYPSGYAFPHAYDRLRKGICSLKW